MDIQEDTAFTIFVSDARGQTVRTRFPSIGHIPLQARTHFRVVDGPRVLSRPLVHVPIANAGGVSAYECIRSYSGTSPYASAQQTLPCTTQDHAAIALLDELDAQCASASAAPLGGLLGQVAASACGSGLTNTSPAATFGQPTSTRLRSTWHFQVQQIPTTGELLENFSDQIRIREIRVFVERGGVREYIRADQIQRISVNGQDCEIPDAAIVAVVDMSLCVENENYGGQTRRRIVANPAWVDPDVQTLAEWEVRFRTINQGGTFQKGLAVRPGERVFLEFTMVQR